MRKTIKNLSIIIMALVLSLSLNAQDAKQFQGIITYKLSAEGNLSEAEKAQVEGDITIAYGNGVYKQLTKTMMATQTQIVYEDSLIMIFEQMGQQYAFRMTKEEAELLKGKKDTTEAEDKAKVNLMDVTKDILKHTCNKAEIIDGENITEVFYDPGYIVEEFMREEQFKEVEGLILEYIIPFPKKEDATIHVIATTLKKKKKMKAKYFAIPDGVDVMSFEQFKALMGG